MLLKLPRPFFVLAPMYDVTDTVFRQIVASLNPPDLFFTEFVNVDGLQSPGRENLLKRLRHTASERPLVAQIWGSTPDNFYKTASELVDMGFAGIDLNMGCPDKTVVRQGLCSGLIRNRDHAQAIIHATQSGAAGRVPVSVKTRLGFEAIDFSWHEFLLEQRLAMLTIHGRVSKQMSRGKADWDAIGHIRALRDTIAPGTLIVGNGDVNSREIGLLLAARYELDGIMIGRGIFQDPYVFAAKSRWSTHSKYDRCALYLRHAELFGNTWHSGERPLVTLNKFCKIYITGFDGAQELRANLMSAGTIRDLRDILQREMMLTELKQIG